MTRKQALTILRLSNALVRELHSCDDSEFLDRVLATVMSGGYIDEDEVFEIVMGVQNDKS